MLHKLMPAARDFFGRTDDRAVIGTVTAISSTCRRLYDVYSEVLYGENQFVYELFTGYGRPGKIIIQESPEAAEGEVGHHGIESSYCWREQTDDDTLWPLKPRNAHHIKKFSVLVDLGRRHGELATEEDYPTVSWELGQVIGLFASGHRLRRLVMDVICSARRSSGAHTEPRLVCGVQSDGRLTLAALKREECSEVVDSVGGLWDIVGVLRDIRNAELGGLIREEDALAIVGRMQTPC